MAFFAENQFLAVNRTKTGSNPDPKIGNPERKKKTKQPRISFLTS